MGSMAQVPEYQKCKLLGYQRKAGIFLDVENSSPSKTFGGKVP